MRRKISKQDILDAGHELMFLKGYNDTGIKEITERVNIPKGSFYNHFSSKEEFGVQLLQQYCDRGTAWHKKVLLESDLPPLERIDAFYSSAIENYRSVIDCKLGCMMGNFSAELADVNETFRSVLDERFNEMQQVIAECLQEGQRSGDITKELDPNSTAAFILNSWHGAILRMKSTASVQPLELFKANIFRMLRSQ